VSGDFGIYRSLRFFAFFPFSSLFLHFSSFRSFLQPGNLKVRLGKAIGSHISYPDKAGRSKVIEGLVGSWPSRVGYPAEQDKWFVTAG
jgi:hypothetical protein